MKILNKVLDLIRFKKKKEVTHYENEIKLKSFNIPNFGNNVSEDEERSLILIHKIGVSGMSRQMAEEKIQNYIKYQVEPLEKAKISIHNVIFPLHENDRGESGVEAIYPYMVDVYPTITYLAEEFNGIQSKTQSRKIKIDSVLKS
jgi:hypothetical protein